MPVHGGADAWVRGEAVKERGGTGWVGEMRERSNVVEGVLKAV